MNQISLVQYSFIALIGCLSLFLNTPTPEPTAIPKTVYQIAVSGDRRVLAVMYGAYPYRSIVDFFDSTNGQLLYTVDFSPLAVNQIALSPTGDRLLFTSDAGSELNIYDSHQDITETLWKSMSVSIERIRWNPANDEIAYELGSVQILDAGTREWLYAIGAGPGLVVDLSWDSDGSRLATSSYQPYEPILGSKEIKSIKVWDLSTSEEILTVPTFSIEDQGGGSVALSPDGKQLAFIDEKQLLIYDLDSQQIEAELSVETEYFSQIEWNPTGNLLATGGSEIRIWDTASWKIEKEIKLNRSVVNLQWSFDGQHIFNDGGLDGLYLDDQPVSELELSSGAAS